MRARDGGDERACLTGMREPRGTITIGEPRLERLDDGRSRVAVDVDGEPLWVAAAEPLAANADAPVAALLLSAAKSGSRLRVAADLDERLHSQLGRIPEIARAYWKFPGAVVEPRGLARRAPGGAGAVFFSGGLDSFYTLHRRRREIDRLICVHGLDIPIDDADRFARARGWISAVAAGVGVRAVFAAANFRRHRL